MAGGKEIRTKIKSVQNTRKITKAMEMVAASKMRKAQERMWAARPYAEKVRQLAANLSAANITEYKPPLPEPRGKADQACWRDSDHDRQGLVRRFEHQHPAHARVEHAPVGGQDGCERYSSDLYWQQGSGFRSAHGRQGHFASHPAGRHAAPGKAAWAGQGHDRRLQAGELELDVIYVANTRFVNTMKQEPVIDQLLPLTGEQMGTSENRWDYRVRTGCPSP